MILSKKMKRIGIISHRGGFLPEGPIPEVQDRYEIPENTIQAFERAFGNDWGIETDIRITGDGNFVVIHDGDVVRFSNASDIIDKMSIQQVRDVGYKTDPKFRISTLDRLCELAQKNAKQGQAPFIAFQVKRGCDPESGVAVGRAVAKKMHEHHLENSILFDATLEEAKVLHAEFPWLNLSVSVGEENYSPTIYTPDQVLTPEFSSVYTSIWADEWKVPGSIYNQELFNKLRWMYKGRIDVISPELHYNENHPFAKDLNKLKSLWKEILNWGSANGICTDYPSTLATLVQDISM